MAKVLKWEITNQIDVSNKSDGPQSIPTEATFTVDFGKFSITAKTSKCDVKDESFLINEAKDIIKSIL